MRQFGRNVVGNLRGQGGPAARSRTIAALLVLAGGAVFIRGIVAGSTTLSLFVMVIVVPLSAAIAIVGFNRAAAIEPRAEFLQAPHVESADTSSTPAIFLAFPPERLQPRAVILTYLALNLLVLVGTGSIWATSEERAHIGLGSVVVLSAVVQAWLARAPLLAARRRNAGILIDGERLLLNDSANFGHPEYIDRSDIAGIGFPPIPQLRKDAVSSSIIGPQGASNVFLEFKIPRAFESAYSLLLGGLRPLPPSRHRPVHRLYFRLAADADIERLRRWLGVPEHP